MQTKKFAYLSILKTGFSILTIYQLIVSSLANQIAGFMIEYAIDFY